MIYLHKEDVSFVPKQIKKIKQVLTQLVEKEGFMLDCVNLILCSDPYLYKVNVEYLDHHYNTDIITFDNSEKRDSIEGDLFISIDTCKSNSKAFNVSVQNEFRRLCIHGVLHLCGYMDGTDEEKAQMRLKEEEYLAYFC